MDVSIERGWKVGLHGVDLRRHRVRDNVGSRDIKLSCSTLIFPTVEIGNT